MRMYKQMIGFVSVVGLVLVSVVGASAETWDLAADFSVAPSSNTTSSTWSYGLAAAAENPVHTSNLFDVNSDANTVWGTTFGTSPTVLSGPTTASFNCIGRNDNGVTQTSAPVSWAPGEILMHPANAIPGRLVISWLAPSTTVVDIDYSWADAMPGIGNGVGLRIWHNSTVIAGWLDPTAAGSYTIEGLSVTAGDRLYFEYDCWANAGGDITRTAITITSPDAATPGTLIYGK